MRKFFSFFAALLFAGSMMATEVTFTKDDFAGQGTANTGSEVSAVKDGVTFTFSKGYCADESLRCYAHGALSITAETTIEKINFTTTGGKTGGLDAEVTVGATSYSVADLASQARFTQIVVTLEGGEPVVEHTYTVAGNDAAIFGEAWNPALTANDMTLANGIYKWEKAELDLTAGDIEFKVVKNHSWHDYSYPAQNYVLNIAEDGEYTITITFDPFTSAVAAEAVKKVIPQYEVAEAIAAGLTDDTEILVRGVITKMEFKGKNFAKYGSVNIYVADATGAEGAFEFYNCYSLNADTFRTSDPAYDAESTAWVEFEEVADENGNAIHVGDTVIAFGKYKLYNSTHELNTGCYLTEIKHPGDAPVDPQPAELVAVSDSTTWEFNKLAANQESALYNNEGIQLTEESTPSKNDEVIYSEYDETILTIGEGFNGAALSFKGEYPIRKNKYCQAGELHFKAAVAGNIIVKFSDTGSKASATAVKRYLVVNDEQTEYWASRENNGEADPYPAQLDVTTGSIPVPAGDVIIKGSSAIVVYFVTFVPEAAPQPEHTYSVVGPLTPGGWDATSTACDMALGEDGKYHFVMSEVQLVANAVNEYKIVEDHAWAVAFPQQGNAEFTVEKSGIYDLEFVLDLNAETPYSVIPTLIEEIVVVPSIAMHGNFLGSWADTENFTVAEDNATASLSLNIAAGNYEFGMRIGSSSNWTANGAAFTRENNGAVIEAGQGNLTLAADLAGEYLFTWTFADNSLAITFPSDAPVVPDTVVLGFEDGWVDTQYFEEYGSTDLVLYNIPVDPTTHRYVGDGQYINLDFYPEDANDITGTYSIADETLDDYYTYMLDIHGTDTAEVVFTAGEVTFEVLQTSVENNLAQIAIAAELTGDDGNIYTINGTFVLYYDFLPTEEGVENVATDPKAAIKRIVNGQLVIEKAGKTYNAQGTVIR